MIEQQTEPEAATRTGLRVRRPLSVWPRYDAAVLGFPEYWYPVMRVRELPGRKPKTMVLLGQEVVFFREGAKVYAMVDQCPHRGVPLRFARRVFDGTISCVYHGWTFGLEDGELKAAITDGPDSPICGKVRVKTFPVQQRAGMLWIYMGQGTPPPLEDDMPDEFLEPDAAITSRIIHRKGNWRYAAENGFDLSHALFLHRTSWWVLTRHLPIWVKGPRIVPVEGGWLNRQADGVAFEEEYPGLGTYPPRVWYKKIHPGQDVSIHLPGFLRVRFFYKDGSTKYTHYEWYVPTDAKHHLYLQFLVKRTSALGRLIFKLRYWTYIRWLFHGNFNDQDKAMVELMPETVPERLFRPDISITAWRKLCEHARGAEYDAELAGAHA